MPFREVDGGMAENKLTVSKAHSLNVSEVGTAGFSAFVIQVRQQLCRPDGRSNSNTAIWLP